LLSLLSTPTCLNSAALTQRRAPARGYFRDNASSLLSKSIDHIKRWFLVIRIAREAYNTSWIMLRVDTQTRIATEGTLKCRVNIQSIIFIQHILMNTLQNVAETFLKYSRASHTCGPKLLIRVNNLLGPPNTFQYVHFLMKIRLSQIRKIFDYFLRRLNKYE
jgi:hypothetical protein